jgi:hypothetical protein
LEFQFQALGGKFTVNSVDYGRRIIGEDAGKSLSWKIANIRMLLSIVPRVVQVSGIITIINSNQP